ncbi:MAG: hypothetical protein OHK0053_28380 [Microscillaceae bacterium]
MQWMEKLRQRWKLRSLGQVFWVLMAFACTGFTVLLIRKPLLQGLGLAHLRESTGGVFLYLLLVLPVYQVLLLLYGLLFGQFSFFWEFEKKMFRRMWLWRKKKPE